MVCWSDCIGFLKEPVSRATDAFVESRVGEALGWVWNQTAGRIASMIILSSLAEKLRRERRHLSDERAEVLEEVEIGKLENKGLRPSAKTWLEEVGRVVDDAAEFHGSFAPIEGFSLSSRYKLGGKADKLLKEVRELKERKENLVILGEATPDRVKLQAVPQQRILGIECNFSEIFRMLDDDSCPIIGIYGMGGIGKTTLLKEVNNKVSRMESEQFNVVIFVTVSKNVNIWDIQKVIGNRLGYSDDWGRPLPSNTNERKEKILESLVEKKFLLLFDDIWVNLKLHEIGIPLSGLSQKGSKIVFTTRSHKVCIEMGAANNKIEVRPLSESISWQLFCEKLGKTREDEWNVSAKFLAKEVVKKCGGLPLALITMGSSMASADTDAEWEEALTMLADIGADPGDMKDVLSVLKFSFDRLKDEHKKCLLYCALYPEDYCIDKKELIEYWIGEGFLEKANDTICRVRNRGVIAINALKNACLLEDGNIEEVPNTVKLHNMIHKMAIWITSRDCENEETIFLSKPGEDLKSAPTYERWKHATRISLSFNSITELPERPECQNLKTLLLARNKSLEQIPSGFFQFMPNLTVLDLSRTGVTYLPNDIGLLQKLRYLDLSNNRGLQSMPEEVWELKNLRILNLNYIGLKTIPKKAISLFSSLQSLNIYDTEIQWRGGWNDHDNKHIEKDVSLKDLDGLKQLEELDLEVVIESPEDWYGLQNSDKLRKGFTSLNLFYLEIYSFYFIVDCWTPNRLRELSITNCVHLNHLAFDVNQPTTIEKLYFTGLPIERIDWVDGTSIIKQPSTVVIFKNLRMIKFYMSQLQEITWTKKLPCLEEVYLSYCPKMVEMITFEELEITSIDSERDSSFPVLRTLDISGMENLKSICNQTLLFPRLKYLFIEECSVLKKLPFQHDSCENLKFIHGEITWWNKLEWDNEHIKSKFNTYFLPHDDGRRINFCPSFAMCIWTRLIARAFSKISL